jgi:hypothetical protein
MAQADLDEIRARAYKLWEEARKPQDRIDKFWYEAEKPYALSRHLASRLVNVRRSLLSSARPMQWSRTKSEQGWYAAGQIPATAKLEFRAEDGSSISLPRRRVLQNGL